MHGGPQMVDLYSGLGLDFDNGSIRSQCFTAPRDMFYNGAWSSGKRGVGKGPKAWEKRRKKGPKNDVGVVTYTGLIVPEGLIRLGNPDEAGLQVSHTVRHTVRHKVSHR